MLNAALLKDHLPLGIALSGGSDSTALLILAVEALGANQLHAITINHGLRDEAAQEAARAGELCASLGVMHETRSLSLKAGSDLQARARQARYDALCAWAAETNVAAIALGHTQDDVAETFLMRLARGSGVDGLAQMPERFERGGTVFLRPLLGASRVDLQAMLDKKAIVWSEDPSNADTRFTRVKMRQARPMLDELGLTQDRLSQTAHWMRAASDVLEQAADTWIAAHAWQEQGDAVFDLAALQTALEETVYRALTRALCNISGNPYRPRLSALKSLMQSETATTLHGCLAYRDKTTLRITQELKAAQKTLSRWAITGPLSAAHTVAPLGEIGLSQIENWRDSAVLPRRSLLSSPAIWVEDQLIAAPLAKPDTIWTAHCPNPLHLPK